MENALLDLKSERQKRNIPLDKIAAETRISLRYLQSIEEGRFDDLPGGVYNRAFIKAYCESINLDPDEVLKRYEEMQPSVLPEKRAKAIIPLSEPDSFSLRAPVIVWSLIVLAAGLGVYVGRGRIADTFSPYFSQGKETPEALSAPAEDSPPEESAFAEGDLQPQTSLPGGLSGESALEDIQLPPPEAMTGDFQALEDAIPPPSVIPAEVKSPEAKIRIVLKATESCWIHATVDGVPSSQKLMTPGGTESFFADDHARIKIGNAGGISLIINDKPAKPLGGAGEVVILDVNPLNIKQFTD